MSIASPTPDDLHSIELRIVKTRENVPETY